MVYINYFGIKMYHKMLISLTFQKMYWYNWLSVVDFAGTIKSNVFDGSNYKHLDRRLYNG
jgi:hypothetical protein